MQKMQFTILQVVKTACRYGSVMINQYDQHPNAIAFRRAVYRAREKGLLKRIKSPPSRLRFEPTSRALPFIAEEGRPRSPSRSEA